MKYRLLALDFDGTLLTYGRPNGVSERVLAALRAARGAGVLLCAATGRSLTEAGPALENMAGLFHYGVMANGAQVYRFPDDLIAAHTFTQESVTAILRVLRRYPDLFQQAFLEAEPFCEASAWQNVRLRRLVEGYTEMAGCPISATPSFEELFARGGLPGKLFLIGQDAAQAAEIADAIRALGVADVTGSAEDNVEILPPGVNKASGIQTVCAAHGIAPDEVMAIGDSDNDRTMLEFAGLGVAMGNAPDCLKATANAVTDSVDDDGAAHAIERYLLTEVLV